MLKIIFKLIKNIVKFAVSLFCILLIAIILIQRFSNNEVTLFGFRIFNVATESMVPKYNVGDILIVKSIEPDDVKEGDDITYLGEVGSFANRIVTHKVIKIELDKNGEKIFHTKGIANDSEDPTIKGHQIYGKVLYKFIAISYFSNIINNMYCMYILLFVSIGIVMIMEIRDYRKMKDEDDDNDKQQEADKEKQPKKSRNRMRERRRKRQQRKEKRSYKW